MPGPGDVLDLFSPLDPSARDAASAARREMESPSTEDSYAAAAAADMLRQNTREAEAAMRACAMGLTISGLLVLLVMLAGVYEAASAWRQWKRWKTPDGLLVPGGRSKLRITGDGNADGENWKARPMLASTVLVLLDPGIMGRLPLSEIRGTVLWILRLLKKHGSLPASPVASGHEGAEGGLMMHSINVGLKAMELALEREGVSPRAALTAGLAHDLGKVMTYGDGIEKGRIHDKASAYLLNCSRPFRREFDENQREIILTAVGLHHNRKTLPVNSPWNEAGELLDLVVKADRACALHEIRKTGAAKREAAARELMDEEIEAAKTAAASLKASEGEVDEKRGIFWVPEIVIRRLWIEALEGNADGVSAGWGEEGPPESWDRLYEALGRANLLHQAAGESERGLFEIEVEGERKQFRVPVRLEKVKRRREGTNSRELEIKILGPAGGDGPKEEKENADVPGQA